MSRSKSKVPASLARGGRRAFLRSATVGIGLALPAFELLRPAPARGATPRKKLALFHFPNGAHPEDWSLGPVGEIAQLPPMFSALEPRRAELTVVSGLSSVAAGADYGCSSGSPHMLPVLTCMSGLGLSCTETNWPAGRSIDFAAAEVLGPTAVPSLYVRPYGAGYNPSVTAAGGGTGVTPITRPSVLFTTLFADGSLTPEALEQLRARRVSILDFVSDEIDELEAAMGTADRQRLEHHLDTVRQLEIEADLAAQACTAPDAPPGSDPADPPDAELPARTDLLMDLAVTALRCDITDVLLFSVGMSQGTPTYSFLDAGTPLADAHQTSHLQAGTTDEERRFWWLETNRYHMSKMARLLDLLHGDDGGAPIVERTVVVGFSEMGFGANHSPYNLPCIVGGAGHVGGRHLHVPCAIVDPSYPSWAYGPYNLGCTDAVAATPIANLWATVLGTLGADAPSFGESTDVIDGLW